MAVRASLALSISVLSFSLVSITTCCFPTTTTTTTTTREVKVESTMPTVTMSPPEGNTTFLGGTTWCVALHGAAESDLQRALDWACGPGGADCGHLEQGRECFEPNTLESHASFAFNSYYQQNGNSDIACYFGGVAGIVTHNPSYGSCTFLSSSDPVSGSTRCDDGLLRWSVVGILLLFYF